MTARTVLPLLPACLLLACASGPGPQTPLITPVSRERIDSVGAVPAAASQVAVFLQGSEPYGSSILEDLIGAQLGEIPLEIVDRTSLEQVASLELGKALAQARPATESEQPEAPRTIPTSLEVAKLAGVDLVMSGAALFGRQQVAATPADQGSPAVGVTDRLVVTHLSLRVVDVQTRDVVATILCQYPTGADLQSVAYDVCSAVRKLRK